MKLCTCSACRAGMVGMFGFLFVCGYVMWLFTHPAPPPLVIKPHVIWECFTRECEELHVDDPADDIDDSPR
jgi:hypothetical protein